MGFNFRSSSATSWFSSATVESNNSARGRRSEKSPVDTARRLVNTLSDLEHETAASIWTNKSPARDSVLKSHNEPAPLDRYLNYPHNEGTPYPKLHHHSRERKAQELHLENLSEAKAVMKQLELTRETLESNLQQVLRSRRDMNIFTTLASSSLESQVEEQKKIEAMVNKKISSLQEDIQREVLRGLAQQETDILATKVEVPRQKTVARKGPAKQEINRGKAQAEYMARLAVSKSNVPHYTSDMASRGKENRTSKVKPPPKVAMIKDEKTLTRTYGKLEHQRGRTTIRDPYLHFKNPKTGRAARPAPVNESFVSGEGRSRSPPRRHRENPLESPAPRQFYFSPTRGYIPLGAGDTAPIPGQLIHMAIPLGQPRMEPGVRRSEMPMTMTGVANPVTSTPVPVTAARNVTLISFPVEEDKKKKGREPELAKQVLPPIDIDSISPSSSQRSDIHIRSPQQGNVNMTFLQDMQDEKSELDLDKTMIEDNSVLEQSGEGIQLPGYEPKVSDHFGPEFPPHTSRPGPGWAAGDGQGRQSGVLVSDVMAEDLRRRDALENNAIYWLEQELMARVLSQVIPLHPQPDTNPDMNRSEVSDKEDSLLVADMIGQGGMQLFIDAGQPVNNALVQALIKEVLQEKISSMLAQRSVDGQTQAGEVKSDSEIEARGQDEPQRVPTPQPTPPASPVRSPGPVLTRNVATPPESPPPAGHKFVLEEMVPELTPSPVRLMQSPPRPLRQADLESETETSVSIDISEELRRVGASKHAPEEPSEPVSIRHDVATPPFSPVPVIQAEAPPPRVTTPPTSPRQQLRATVTTNEVKAAQGEEAKEDEEDKEEDEEDMIEQDQPKPIMMSVALGRDEPMTLDMPDTVKAPSPTQKPQEAPGSPDLSSLSSDSSLTETINEVFSDGQWLLSEGEAVGVPLNHAKRKELLLHRNHKNIGDVSSASTLRDTEDLAADDYDFPQSEGEILITGLPAPEEDSMLDLLAELQRNPFEAAHKDLPGPHIRQILSGPQPRIVMSNTGRSLGEISIGQVPPSQMAMETRNRERQVTDQEANHMDSDSDLRTKYAKTEKTKSQDELRKPHSRSPSPKVDRSSRSPSPGQKTRPTLPNQRTSRSPSPQKKLQIDSRGRPRAAHLQYQPVLSEGAPKPTRGKTQLSLGRRSSDSWLSQNSDRGMRGSRSSYLTESVSRSADSPSFRRTGEGAILTSSLKSRNSAGVKKSVEFDLSGTYERTRDSSGPLTDYSQSYSQSFGMTDSLVDSLDESELKNIGQSTEYRSGVERLTLKIPSSADGGDSDLSEMDLTNNS
nr:TALPID3 protein-like [Biomphalaria glabrata]